MTTPDRPSGAPRLATTLRAQDGRARARPAGRSARRPARPGSARRPARLTEPDVLVACAYGRIVPADVFDALPSLVVHPSLVPHWRGAAPVLRALMAGETRLGVATLEMTAGVDEGPVADERVVESAARRRRRQGLRAARRPRRPTACWRRSPGMADGSVVFTPQVGACRLRREDHRGRPGGRLAGGRPRAIADQVRALSPDVGAHTELGGERRLVVWKAIPANVPALRR